VAAGEERAGRLGQKPPECTGGGCRRSLEAAEGGKALLLGNPGSAQLDQRGGGGGWLLSSERSLQPKRVLCGAPHEPLGCLHASPSVSPVSWQVPGT
jgi:hypothetical protein